MIIKSNIVRPWSTVVQTLIDLKNIQVVTLFYKAVIHKIINNIHNKRTELMAIFTA